MNKTPLHYIILLTAIMSLQACLSDKVTTSDAINTQHYSTKVLKAADIKTDLGPASSHVELSFHIEGKKI